MARNPNLHQDLIEAGIAELNEVGPQAFSVRRIADKVGISCATPYKHFADRDDFIAKIIEYIMGLWALRSKEIIAAHPDDYRSQLVELSVGYVQFLVENSYYRSVIMIKDPAFDAKYGDLRHGLSSISRELAKDYAKKQGLSSERFDTKVFVVRSLIYGAALMFDNKELDYNPKNLAMVRSLIEREFDL